MLYTQAKFTRRGSDSCVRNKKSIELGEGMRDRGKEREGKIGRDRGREEERRKEEERASKREDIGKKRKVEKQEGREGGMVSIVSIKQLSRLEMFIPNL